MTYHLLDLPLGDSDPTLVLMKGGHPHCSKHGAMNSVSRFEKDGSWFLIWRCVTTYAKEPDFDTGRKRKQIGGLKANACLAGCVTNSLFHPKSS